MTLHINEAEVRAMLTMAMAMEAVEEVSRKQSTGEVVVHPRRRFELPGGGFFHYMAAADYSGGHIAMKQYTYSRGKVRFLVPLYAMATGDLLAMIEADYMGQLRTGAATGIATKYLSRANARVAAIIGTGRSGGKLLRVDPSQRGPSRNLNCASISRLAPARAKAGLASSGRISSSPRRALLITPPRILAFRKCSSASDMVPFKPSRSRSLKFAGS